MRLAWEHTEACSGQTLARAQAGECMDGSVSRRLGASTVRDETGASRLQSHDATAAVGRHRRKEHKERRAPVAGRWWWMRAATRRRMRSTMAASQPSRPLALSVLGRVARTQSSVSETSSGRGQGSQAASQTAREAWQRAAGIAGG